MGFLQPLALLGLAAAGIPALLHLLQRRVPPTVDFPAVRYLSETERRHSRRLKLRNLLLLLLRTALIACVVLAAARPVAHLPLGRAHGPSALAVVVDNSLSSGAVVNGRRTSDLLADEARAVVRRADAADHLWLVLADGVPVRLTPAEARTRLDSLAPEPVRLDLGEAVRAAGRVVRDDGLPGEVVVLSDLQASALSPGTPPAVPVLVWTPPPGPGNRGVDSAWTVPASWLGGGRVVAAIGGRGAPADVQLEIGGRVVAHALAAPGATAVFDVPAPAFGWHTARVVLPPDELRADDAFDFAVRRVAPPRVAVRTGAGPFVADAIQVLEGAGHVDAGTDVVLDDALSGNRVIVVPPADPALVGPVNRALAARGIAWRYAARAEGSWAVTGELPGLEGARVLRRQVLRGPGGRAGVLADAGGTPWIVRAGDVVLLGSRLEAEWTTLPVSAGFVPFLDRLVGDLGAGTYRRVHAAPGDQVALPASGTALLGPAGRVPIPADGRVTAPRAVGVYFILGAAGDTIGVLAVNHDPRETRLVRAEPQALAASFGPSARIDAATALDRDLFRGAHRADLAGWFLVLALAAALVELGVATAGGRR